ncbi:hypothetical protein OAB94_01835 [Flavobacteriaceae bacterium]|nr:hypothetical protein [Flavobacteriaceae bacterium]
MLEKVLEEVEKRLDVCNENYRKAKGVDALEYGSAGLELLKLKHWLIKEQIRLQELEF